MSSSYVYRSQSTVYLGHDNTVTVVPYADIVNSVLFDMTDVTKVDVSADPTTSTTTGDDITASSDDSPVTVWWAYDTPTGEWLIHIKVGLFTSMVAGNYNLRVVIFDPTYPNGLVVADDLLVEVVEIP